MQRTRSQAVNCLIPGLLEGLGVEVLMDWVGMRDAYSAWAPVPDSSVVLMTFLYWSAILYSL